ncbi:DUF2125 domain-containing protein [Cochlodiniinecator piscidefendens]|uniref:DUF2125 domain-containing protein n=1 Tax=Cochlodiniinecator piscidefendens TaxID=2715756 RepID=UPI00140B7C94|nr:DUF2125 domain-containing protein [Cochlodiniinecator piscidefendens]
MRVLMTLLIVFTVGWTGYWFVGSTAIERGFKQWFEDAASNGVVAEYSELRTQGIPNRFDTTIEDVRIANDQFEWRAPFFQIFALSYKPNHIIAVWPSTQSIIVDGTALAVNSEDMRASLILEPSTHLVIDRFQWAAEGLTIASLEQEPIQVQNAAVALRQTPGQANAYDLSVQLPNLSLPESLPPLGNNVTATLGLTAQFNSQIALANALPELTEVSINTARIQWGPASMTLTGMLTRDINGYGAGTLTAEIEQWRAAFAGLVHTGVVQPGWEGAFAALENENDILELPLLFQNGRIAFGPFDLGSAPRF